MANNMGLFISQMGDLNGNIGSNITYALGCNFNIEIEENNSFNLFPNPNNGQFNIQLNNNENTLSIYNIKGQIVFSKELKKGIHPIVLNQAGFYYLEINNSNKTPLIIY